MFKLLDLFCGAGGMTFGFKDAGFDIAGGIDFNFDAIQTHKYNFPQSVSICDDITKIDNILIRKYFSNIDVIIGGPPCQGFSVANKWQTDEEKIEKNKLFFEYIKFVKEIKPKVFVIENVRQILTKDDGFAKKQIETICSELGYNVVSNVLNACDFGVPQKRLRAFFVGIRNDLQVQFDFNNLVKDTKDKVTVSEAISDFYSLEEMPVTNILKHKPKSNYQIEMRKNSNNIIYNHEIKYPNDKVRHRMSFVPQGGNWRNVPVELWDTKRNNRHSSAYRRLNENECSITIDTGHMNYFHPIFDRVPTVRESARLQSFPDDFVFIGSKGSQFMQVGNAVPPLMAKELAKEILKILEGNHDV